MRESLVDLPEGRLNVFFAFTPFNQLMVAELLALEEFAGSPSLVIDTCSRPLQIDGAEVVHFCGRDYGLLARVVMYRRVAAMLKKLRREARIASISCPHPHNLLSNDLVFARDRHAVNLYEDGMANYLASDNVALLKRKSLFKVLLAPLLGFHYQGFDGHITGIEQREMDCGFFLNPELVLYADRFHRLVPVDPFRADGVENLPLSDVVLVLDQDIEGLFSGPESEQLRTRLSQLVCGLQLEVFLKCHPSQREADSRLELGGRVSLCDNQATAEQLALELRPRYVVSFVSSALKNIKNILPESECFSLGAVEVDRQRGTQLAALFRKLGINVID